VPFIDNRIGPEAHSVPKVLLRRGIAVGEVFGWKFANGWEGRR
jgi:hypothetical protein